MQARSKRAPGGLEAFKELVKRIGKLEKVDGQSYVVLKQGFGGAG